MTINPDRRTVDVSRDFGGVRQSLDGCAAGRPLLQPHYFTMASWRTLPRELEPVWAGSLAGHPWANWSHPNYGTIQRLPGAQSRGAAGRSEPGATALSNAHATGL